jgi:hypothetical protein
MVGTVGNGFTLTNSVAVLPLPQEFVPITETLPDVQAKVTVMVLVLRPEVIVAPGGTPQIYVEALVIGGTEYTTPVL